MFSLMQEFHTSTWQRLYFVFTSLLSLRQQNLYIALISAELNCDPLHRRLLLIENNRNAPKICEVLSIREITLRHSGRAAPPQCTWRPANRRPLRRSIRPQAQQLDFNDDPISVGKIVKPHRYLQLFARSGSLKAPF